MRFLVILLISLSFACNQARNDRSAKMKETSTSNVTKMKNSTPIFDNHKKPIDTTPPKNILAQFWNPNIIIYQNNESSSCGLNYCVYMTFNDGSCKKDVLITEDNAVNVNQVSIDTISFSNGKYPEVILEWVSYGSHLYGGWGWELGGWTQGYHVLSIWDINKMEEVFYAFPYKDSYSREIEDGKEIESACTFEYRLRVNKVSREIIIDSLSQSTKGKCLDKFDKEEGTYVYKNDRFVKKQ